MGIQKSQKTNKFHPWNCRDFLVPFWKKCWHENYALVSLPCNVINRDNDITNEGEEEEEDREEAEKRLKLQQELLDKDQMIERLKMQLNQQSDYEKMKRELL